MRSFRTRYAVFWSSTALGLRASNEIDIGPHSIDTTVPPREERMEADKEQVPPEALSPIKNPIDELFKVETEDSAEIDFDGEDGDEFEDDEDEEYEVDEEIEQVTSVKQTSDIIETPSFMEEEEMRFYIRSSQAYARTESREERSPETVVCFSLKQLEAPIEADCDATMTPPTVSAASWQNARDYPNQDAYQHLHAFVKGKLEYSVLFVLDGHGESGAEVSHGMLRPLAMQTMDALMQYRKMEQSTPLLGKVLNDALYRATMGFLSVPANYNHCSKAGSVYLAAAFIWRTRKGVTASLGDATAWVVSRAASRATPWSALPGVSDSNVDVSLEPISEDVGMDNPKYLERAVSLQDPSTTEARVHPRNEYELQVKDPFSRWSITTDAQYDSRLAGLQLAASMCDLVYPVLRTPVLRFYHVPVGDARYILLTSDGITHKYDSMAYASQKRNMREDATKELLGMLSTQYKPIKELRDWEKVWRMFLMATWDYSFYRAHMSDVFMSKDLQRYWSETKGSENEQLERLLDLMFEHCYDSDDVTAMIMKV